VPTIIFYKDGSEIGRIVENTYRKYEEGIVKNSLVAQFATVNPFLRLVCDL
jgi:hypothetical protein